MEDIKAAVFNDEVFKEYRSTRNDVDVVCDLMEFKWTLTDQIAANEQYGDRGDLWKRSITSLVIRVKSRIAEVKRDVRADGKGEELDDALLDLREDRNDD